MTELDTRVDIYCDELNALMVNFTSHSAPRTVLINLVTQGMGLVLALRTENKRLRSQ